MSKDLYFIRFISEALSQPYAEKEIRQAMKRIIHVGQGQGYKRGYTQFRQFMQKVFETSENEVPWLDGAWEDLTEGAVLKINIARDEKLIASLPLKPSNIPLRISDAVVGHYTFQLNTGRMLWMGEIMETDLFLIKAFPDSDLKLAATTEGWKLKPSKQIRLLGGEIVIQIFPGFESGIIEVQRLK